ncbi:hypothetical protein [Brachyspira pilosicoli]|uniref:Lipoprotein n=1 Tax=Brachyspira pilosicoli TaxID=52584 RepID=A0A5C8EYX0_BRAPL|nr:hypothetical protein [Brachyspira pilosicoli]TXJ43197.1 hypothetical protein EPJ72_04635 [Brachyspira pilosicoli]
MENIKILFKTIIILMIIVLGGCNETSPTRPNNGNNNKPIAYSEVQIYFRLKGKSEKLNEKTNVYGFASTAINLSKIYYPQIIEVQVGEGSEGIDSYNGDSDTSDKNYDPILGWASDKLGKELKLTPYVTFPIMLSKKSSFTFYLCLREKSRVNFFRKDVTLNIPDNPQKKKNVYFTIDLNVDVIPYKYTAKFEKFE